MSINQNVPSCVASGTNNGCRPNPTYANNSQYSPAADSNYHGLHVSFVQRPAAWGNYRVSYTFSKSMNNVGENFFSSPIDPFDLSKDWGRSDDDQRHRLVFTGGVNTSMAPARDAWEMLSHGFQLSSMLQAYSALPFNITSGVTTIQGTAGPADRERRVHRAQRRHRQRLLQHEPAPEPRVQDCRPRSAIEGLAEVFNLTNRPNNLTRNTNFGPGAYPTNPSPTFSQITAVGDPRTWQFAVRARF